ncbi:MAG: hypothetical protein CVU31_02675 [Betaproteobacteria bacterium HGW-Betaproteobacteria-4]|jgi:hypothetical protein|nr:MAG: hypothetical protein CVU31_02675 [Betaproteobacteria bacterium HGW-Betaproteobacteria-4]
MSDLFYLQDSRGLTGENMMFWAFGGGYTSDIRQAEVFSKEAAVRQHQSRESDIPWPAEYIKGRFYTPVDMQHLRHADGNSRDVAFYEQVPGRWIGNDCLWVYGSTETTDLRLASVFASLQPGCVMWPVEEIQKLARPAVRASDVSIKEALDGSGIVINKPKRTKREVFNCHQCGRFISEDQRFFDCPNCGAENRP